MASTLEIRNIYPGEALFADDLVIRRAQTFGSTSTLNSDDIHEIGNFNIVEAIDNVPAVAITCDTDEYASLRNLAIFCNRNPGTANYVSYIDFQNALVDLYAPVIRNKYYGLINTEVASVTATNGESPVFRTQYIENAYVNNITCSYTTGGMATENYALESDNKRWFFNNGSNVVCVSGVIDTDGTTVPVVPAGQTGTFYGFYFGDKGTRVPGIYGPTATQLDNGQYALYVSVASGGVWNEYTYEPVIANLGAGEYYADASGVYFKDAATNGYVAKARYVAPSGGEYFTRDASGLPGMRHGQAEVYIFDTAADGSIKLDASGIYGPSGTPFWRLQSANITVPLGREALLEIGHLKPFARPLTLPIQATVSVESLDHDLELFKRLAAKEAATDSEIALTDLLKDKNLVVKLYRWTDEERSEIEGLLKKNAVTNPYATNSSGICPAAGNFYGASPASGLAYKGKLVNTQDLYPQKVVIMKKLIPTGEAQSLAVGSNATQTFDFRADNTYWVLGPGADAIPRTTAATWVPTTTKDTLQPYDYSKII